MNDYRKLWKITRTNVIISHSTFIYVLNTQIDNFQMFVESPAKFCDFLSILCTETFAKLYQLVQLNFLQDMIKIMFYCYQNHGILYFQRVILIFIVNYCCFDFSFDCECPEHTSAFFSCVKVNGSYKFFNGVYLFFADFFFCFLKKTFFVEIFMKKNLCTIFFG